MDGSWANWAHQLGTCPWLMNTCWHTLSPLVQADTVISEHCLTDPQLAGCCISLCEAGPTEAHYPYTKHSDQGV